MNHIPPKDEQPDILDDVEASRAPLLDHLIELRKRLMWSLLGFVVAFIACYFFAEEIYAFLTHPLAVALEGQPGRRMIYTALYETFFTYIKVAGFGALCISFPIIASQIWMFVAPGLYRNERRAFLPFLFATPVLFAAEGSSERVTVTDGPPAADTAAAATGAGAGAGNGPAGTGPPSTGG